ncbi:DMT family transporter [Gimibacter soli]|uniref:Multidrug efflux SMR transporter n=1 Tax=Gimibacter soli TaxID=3024400 RepID=A0AAE9XQC6_9PROT|nr:multidrug efflux SMR transporter [Gimibacter soli]WCL55257.1 multidrug efflux SMR transporter [Gimibacter soli]
MHYLYLGAAIFSEIVGTLALKSSEQFTRPVPTLVMAVGYGIAFYMLSLTLKTMPVSVVYAIWSGLGISILTLIDIFYFKSPVNLPMLLGIAMIVGGVVLVEMYTGRTGA